MAKRNKRIQKAAKRKAKVKSKKVIQRSKNKLTSPKTASKWPLIECLISDSWQDPTNLCQILLARRSETTGEIATGIYLLDLGCLGVKNAGYTFETPQSYVNVLKARISSKQTLVPCDLNMAARIIQVAIEYGASLGFKPHKDFRRAKLLLGDADPTSSDIDVPTGKDGQPYYFGGPYDNYDSVIRTLDRSVGRGNYHYVLPMGGDPFGDFDEGWEEDAQLEDGNVIEGDWDIINLPKM